MRQYRALSRGQGTSIVDLYWAGYIINMSGFDLRQAQGMGNGALPNGPSYRAHPRLYRNGPPAMSAVRSLSGAKQTSRGQPISVEIDPERTSTDSSPSCGKGRILLLCHGGHCEPVENGKLFLSAIESVKLFTSRRAAMLQESFSVACRSRWWFYVVR
jgi:hypothetical protein